MLKRFHKHSKKWPNWLESLDQVQLTAWPTSLSALWVWDQVKIEWLTQRRLIFPQKSLAASQINCILCRFTRLCSRLQYILAEWMKFLSRNPCLIQVQHWNHHLKSAPIELEISVCREQFPECIHMAMRENLFVEKLRKGQWNRWSKKTKNSLGSQRARRSSEGSPDDPSLAPLLQRGLYQVRFCSHRGERGHFMSRSSLLYTFW